MYMTQTSAKTHELSKVILIITTPFTITYNIDYILTFFGLKY